MNNCFIILAAGESKRFKSNIPKPYYLYRGKPLFLHSINKAIESKKFRKIILVINKKHKKFIKTKELKNIIIINGGKTRSESSLKALMSIKNSKISKNVTNNNKTLAVRFPRKTLTRKLLKILKYPLAAPSANISTNISPVSKEDVKDEFGKKIKFILDGGQSKIGLESTIINLINKPQILRLGGIQISKINQVLKTNLKFNKKNTNL